MDGLMQDTEIEATLLKELEDWFAAQGHGLSDSIPLTEHNSQSSGDALLDPAMLNSQSSWDALLDPAMLNSQSSWDALLDPALLDSQFSGDALLDPTMLDSQAFNNNYSELGLQPEQEHPAPPIQAPAQIHEPAHLAPQVQAKATVPKHSRKAKAPSDGIVKAKARKNSRKVSIVDRVLNGRGEVEAVSRLVNDATAQAHQKYGSADGAKTLKNVKKPGLARGLKYDSYEKKKPCGRCRAKRADCTCPQGFQD